MVNFASRLTQSNYFQNFIMVVIVVASVLVGIETSPNLLNKYHSLFRILDLAIQSIFTIEIAFRLFAHGKKTVNFFKSGWNTFDFLVTAIYYLPFGGSYAAVLRLVRILRVFRLVSALPKLQMLVGALIKSIPSIGYVALLLFVQFYIYAIVGNFQFGKTDPENFGTLWGTMMTLFEIITLEGWVEIYNTQANAVVATVYFVSFILLGTMIILNLFIGVIIEGFDEIKKEVEESSIDETVKLKSELRKATEQIESLKDTIQKISIKL